MSNNRNFSNEKDVAIRRVLKLKMVTSENGAGENEVCIAQNIIKRLMAEFQIVESDLASVSETGFKMKVYTSPKLDEHVVNVFRGMVTQMAYAAGLLGINLNNDSDNFVKIGFVGKDNIVAFVLKRLDKIVSFYNEHEGVIEKNVEMTKTTLRKKVFEDLSKELNLSKEIVEHFVVTDEDFVKKVEADLEASSEVCRYSCFVGYLTTHSSFILKDIEDKQALVADYKQDILDKLGYKVKRYEFQNSSFEVNKYFYQLGADLAGKFNVVSEVEYEGV